MDDAAGIYVTVGPTDCITSLADANGFFWQTVWDHPNNSDLKNLRRDPNVLSAGDQVYIPAKTLKQMPGATEQRHKFLLKGVPALVRFQFKNGGQPLSNLDYVLNIDGTLTRGKTDGDGAIKFPVPPGALNASLILGTGDKARKYEIDLGSMDPVATDRGVRKRLQGLGFHPGSEADDTDGKKLQSAIRRFQVSQQCDPTGQMDDALRDKLVKAFGC